MVYGDAPGSGGQGSGQVAQQQIEDAVAILLGETSLNVSQLDVGPQIPQVQGGLAAGRSIDIQQPEAVAVPQELLVVEVTVDEHAGAVVAGSEVLAGFHDLSAELIQQRQRPVLPGAFEPPPQHVSLVVSGVFRQPRGARDQAGPGLGEAPPPG